MIVENVAMSNPAPNRVRALYAADAHFVGAHEGAAETELSKAWIPLLQSQSGVASAYLARVRHSGSKDATMALCIRVTDGKVAKTAIGRCAAMFVSRFGADQPLDVLILSEAQERAIGTVCPPFFLSESAAAEKRGVATSPIVWFELQIAPLEFRFAVLPGQPILFGSSDTATWLLRAKENPDAAKALAIGLADVLRSHPFHRSPPNEPEKCFQPEVLKTPSFHLRVAWADGTRWETYHARDAIPPGLIELVEACRRLGLEKIASLGGRRLSAEEALGEVKKSGPS
jgi:hypothetical protein